MPYRPKSIPFREPIRAGLSWLCMVAGIATSAAWEPGTYPATSRGFTVDTMDREDVISFWHGVYVASDGYQDRVGWTGNFLVPPPILTGEGTVSAAFVTDVERRVNYYRAMCGLAANVRVNTGSKVVIDPADPHKPAANITKAAAAQRAAYMVIRTYNTSLAPGNVSKAMSHAPNPADCVGWTAAAWNANANGNISFGFFGPRAIDAYIAEDVAGVSGWNSNVGHRRWLLYPPSTDIATGDTPGSYSPDPLEVRVPTNVLYVAQNPDELAEGVAPRFVSYPSAGFFPAPINSKFWSLTYPEADFSAASIAMSGPGGAVTVTKKALVSGFGDSTLVWEVTGAPATKYVTTDTTYHVTVSGIKGPGIPAAHSYSVTLIHPGVTASATALVGTPRPPATVPVTYWFDPGSRKEAVQVNCYQCVTAGWTEGAEDAHPNRVSGSVSGADLRSAVSYPLLPTFKAVSGSKSFWLSIRKKHDILINSVPDDWFELDRDIIPEAGASLTFKYKRGYMTQATVLKVERSDDAGLSWTAIGATIAGKADGSPDATVTSVAIPLVTSDQPIRLRFRLGYLGSAFGGFYTPELVGGFNFAAYPVGIFVDDITVSPSTWLDRKKINEPPVKSRRFVFDSTSAGNPLAVGSKWFLRKRSKLGNAWLGYEPPAVVTVSASKLDGFDAWAEYEYPVLNGGFDGDDDGDGIPNGIEYAFSLDPISPALLRDEIVLDGPGNKLAIRRPLPQPRPGITYAAEWSDNLVNWSSNGVSVKTNGGIAEANVQPGSGGRFLRWRVSKP